MFAVGAVYPAFTSLLIGPCSDAFGSSVLFCCFGEFLDSNGALSLFELMRLMASGWVLSRSRT